MKRIMFIIFVFIMCSYVNIFAADNLVTRIDTYTYLNNGERFYYTTYDIDGYKAMQIEDLAKILNGTNASFDVIVSNGKYYVNANKPYMGNNAKAPVNSASFNVNKVDVSLNGIPLDMDCYIIDNCTYFKIRDIVKLFEIDLSWNIDNYSLTFINKSDRKNIITLVMRPAEYLDAVEAQIKAQQETEKARQEAEKLRQEELKKEAERKSRIDPNKPMLALTFDDGPQKGNTDRILAALNKTNSKATFFVVGKMAKAYPELVKSIADSGCQIGNHTYSHINLARASEDIVKTEIFKTSNLVYDITGSYTYIGRPPYGSISSRAKKVVNIPYFNWNIDTMDWKYKNANYVKNYVVNNARDGAVILLHDLHKTTADAMVSAIPVLVAKGYQLVTIDELVEFKYGGDVTKVPGYIK